MGKIHKKYDLKGSSVDREATDKEREKALPILKDNDFLADGIKVSIGEEGKEALMETLTADSEFLANLHIMDYSLLLGIHDMDKAIEEALEQEEEEEEDEDYDSGGSAGMALTPPESPNSKRKASSLMTSGHFQRLRSIITHSIKKIFRAISKSKNIVRW